MTVPACLSQKIRQGTVRLYQPLPTSRDLPSLLFAGALIEDSAFRSEVAPKSDSIEWRALACRSFTSFLVVIEGTTYWGSPKTTDWAIKTLEGARPAFPHPDDL